MRTKLVLTIASLLLAVRPGAGQTPQAPQAPGATVTPSLTGTVDVGGLFTSTDGDEARYERYRDTRDGLYSSISLDRDGPGYVFKANAFHVGYRDQRYDATFMGRRVNFVFDWTSVPLNFSYLTRTPYATTGATLPLDDGAQAAVEGRTAVGVPCAPGAPSASCGTPAQVGLAKASRAIDCGLSAPFELRHERDTALLALDY